MDADDLRVTRVTWFSRVTRFIRVIAEDLGDVGVGKAVGTLDVGNEATMNERIS